MANIQDAQQEAMATIDAGKVLLEKILSIFQLMSFSPSLSLTFATNPIGFLLQLLEHLGVTYEDIQTFLINLLITTLPALEIAVKGILLANIKSMIACGSDPRIPDKYRKQHKQPTDPSTSQEYGIDINLESIDLFNKLTINPLSEEGENWYFGNHVDNVYKFARAYDFDAFLWFVMHKGRFPNSAKISNMSTFTDDVHGGGASSVNGNSLLDVVTVQYSPTSSSGILPGNTFTYTGSSEVISLCIGAEYNEDNKIVKNTLVPVSDDWNSVNWYIRRGDFDENIVGYHDELVANLNQYESFPGKKPKQYSKETGICNIQFLDQSNMSDTPLTGLVNNKFRFTILPKPYMHVPNIAAGEPVFRFKKLLFDASGEPTPKGKYSISAGWTETVSGDKIVIAAGGSNIQIDIKSGSVSVGNKNELVKHLIECYPGFTVYEFNYDYVMSMKLFDAKVIATTLLDSLINMRLGINLSVDTEHQAGTDRITEIVKSVLESDDSTIDDCFFSFSNQKYDAMLQNTEKKKAKRKDVSKVNDILNEFDDSAELNKQEDVLKRAINQAAVSVTEGIPEDDKMAVRLNFVTDLVEQLTLALVKCILSPKVMMLFEVNKTIMGGSVLDGGKLQEINFDDVIKAMSGVISAVVQEIKELIIQELMKLVLKFLSPIVAVIASSIIREQIEAYTDAINDILRNCPKLWFKMGGGSSNNDNKLDTVDYADIDVSETKSDEPQTKNC